MSRTKTVFLPAALEADEAYALYIFLKENIAWEEGVRSRSGFTRKAFAISPLEVGEFEEVWTAVSKVLDQFEGDYAVLGLYLNYYEDGKMYTPDHRHPDTQQLVISLGASRTLRIGRRDFLMENGSAVLFGSSVHGVPKDLGVTEGRISVATFMKKLS